jgi:prophage regulatory protein
MPVKRRNSNPVVQRILRKPTVRERIGNPSEATLWRWIRAGNFPAPIRIGPNSVGWLETEINEWIAARAAAGGATH